MTVELNVKMHCKACAKEIKKMLLKVNGVKEVTQFPAAEKVIVKGIGLSPEQLCKIVRRSGKPCQLISPPVLSSLQNEENKEEIKVEAGESEENTEERKTKEEGINKSESKGYVYTPYKADHHYIYANQIFSDENPTACKVM
ncbi:hypothetical protein KP509_01G018500 [Ceratopteris richardii]|nr:hypothetical protein KP509_01G018500 [Ceratopteris richardii]